MPVLSLKHHSSNCQAHHHLRTLLFLVFFLQTSTQANTTAPGICENGTSGPPGGPCTTCPTRYFCEGGQAQACPTGTYADTTGLSTCTTCQTGYFCVEGQAQACPKGAYADTTGLSICILCDRGTVQTGTGMTNPDSCIACLAGTYQTGLGMPALSKCTQCPQGTYQTGVGMPDLSQCIQCPGGTYQPALGIAFEEGCIDCQAGTYQTGQGNPTSAACTACQSGTYSNNPGSNSSQDCTPCNPGTYQTGQGSPTSIDCVLCIHGTYSTTPGANTSQTCVKCDPGTYHTARGNPVGCLPCSPGTYLTAIGSISRFQCGPCAPGTYRVGLGGSAQSDCTNCNPGTYLPYSGAMSPHSCILCKTGTYQTGSGATELGNCTSCPAGTYQGNTGASLVSQCVKCSPGTYQTGTGLTTMDSCLLCDQGKYQSMQGASSKVQCLSCPKGGYQSMYGANNISLCIPCMPGTYQPNLAAMASAQCLLCQAGTYSSGLGSTSNSNCTLCNAGSYMTGLGATNSTECTMCDIGLVQVGTTRSSPAECIACLPGTYQTGQGMGGVGKCLMCPEGTYQTGLGITTDQLCTQCPEGTYQTQRGMAFENTCVHCPTGKFQTGLGIPTSAQCKLCGKGTYQTTTGSTTCHWCQEGSYQTGWGMVNVFQCTLCPEGTYQTGSGMVNLSQCLGCQPGTYQPHTSQTRMEDCLSCPTGTYQTGQAITSSAKCMLCGKGTYQTSTGATNTSDCVKCLVGKFSTGTGVTVNVCTECPAGTYTPTEGTGQCPKCQAGAYQTQTGQTNCSLCQPGTYQPFEGVRFNTDRWCVPCDIGKYQSQSGGSSLSSCKSCPKGAYGSTMGQTACDGCIPGQYQAIESSPMCFSCMSGSYSNYSGATTCSSCKPGEYMDKSGETQCSPCTPGTFQYLLGASQCLACTPGTFQSNESSTRCELCPAGTTQTLKEASGCTSCDPGSFAATRGAQNCTPCQPGRYQPNNSSTVCAICPAGKFQSKSGQSECLECPLGSFQATPGRTGCTPCPTGQFQNKTGTLLCNLCIPGKYTPETGKTSASDCLNCSSGAYTSISGSSTCKLCAPGQYSPISGQTTCFVCPPGLYQEAASGGTCSPCAKGSFSTSQGLIKALDCIQCAKGFYTNSTGSTVCTACGPGEFQPLPNTTQCNSCAPGSYMNKSGWSGTACIACNPGTFSPKIGAALASDCSLCPSGYFSTKTGQTSSNACLICKAGTVSVDQKNLCRPCVTGTYCPPGYHTPIQCVTNLVCKDGKDIQAQPGFLPYLRDNCTAAIPCPSGTQCAGLHEPSQDKGLIPRVNTTHFVIYENGPESISTSCNGMSFSYGYTRVEHGDEQIQGRVLFRLLPLQCPAGQYLTDSACISCDPGTYSTATGALYETTCQTCKPGAYSAQTGATTCTQARPGYFVDTEGAAFPTACTPGTYQLTSNSTGCLPCKPGTFAGNSGLSSCVLCVAGTVQSQHGATVCSQCGEGHFSSPGDALCSRCGAIPTTLDPAHDCPIPRLPPSNLSAIWLSVEGVNQDDCIATGPSSLETPSDTTASQKLQVNVKILSSNTQCKHILRVMGRPELTQTWTVPYKAPQRPTKLTVYPYNKTFYPSLCAKQGFGVLYTVEDELGELHTDLTGARAVINILDPSGQNLLFWMPCTRLPNDPNEKIPLGVCQISFCPTMQITITVSLSWPDGSVQGSTSVSPGPVTPCPPTSAWIAIVELVTPSIPYFPGEDVQVRVRSINSPSVLAVFKFALKILPGVTFISFESAYSTIHMVGDGILSVMGDSESLPTSGSDILGTLTVRLDVAVSGLALIVQIVPNTFQFTLANAVPFAMSTRTSGFSCRYDGYVDLLTDVQRYTTLIAIPRRRLLINWKSLQDTAKIYPTSIDVVGVGNVVKSYSLLPSAECTSLSPGHLVVQTCDSIQPSPTTNGAAQASVLVSYQNSVFTTVNITVAAARTKSMRTIPAYSGLAGRFKIFTRLWDGNNNDIFPTDVDATPFLGSIALQGVRVSTDQWTCFKTGITWSFGSPVLLTGACTPSTAIISQPESLFLFTGGQSTGTMGEFAFNPARIDTKTPQGILMFLARGLLITTGIQNTGVNATIGTSHGLVSVNPATQNASLSNFGASARCVQFNMLPSYPGFKDGLIPVFPPAPSSLHVKLSSLALVTQQDLSGLIPSMTFVTEAVLRFADGSSRSVLTDRRLVLTAANEQLLDVAGLGAMARTSPGTTELRFQLEGMDCISTSITVKIQPSPVESATLICPTCPATLTLADDPLTQQFPGEYLSKFPASAFIVRRILVDGKIIDQYENISVGPSGKLENGNVLGLQSGPLLVSTLFTSTPYVLPVLDRWAVSWDLKCNKRPCTSDMRLTPPGDGAGLTPFAYTTALTLSLSITLANGSTKAYPWLRGVFYWFNNSQSRLNTAVLVYGPLQVDAVFGPEWHTIARLDPLSNSLFVHRLANLVLAGPQMLYQLHCSLVWEESNYTTTAILTDGAHALVNGVYSTTPPLTIIPRNPLLLQGSIKADWAGEGKLSVSFGGQETMLQVQATLSSKYLTSVSLEFLPHDSWSTARDRPMQLLPTLSPPFASGPTDQSDINNLSSRVLRWSSSAPQVIGFTPELGIMTLLSDYYEPLHITAGLLPCQPFPGGSDTRTLTVNVVPSQSGDIDFGQNETGLPMPPSEVGGLLTVPLYIYAPTSLQSYTVEVYLPESAVEPLDCTGGGISNSQCGVVSMERKTFFRAVGAYTQNTLTGRILMLTIHGRILLNTLVAMRVVLIQAVIGSSVIIPSQEYNFILKLGSPPPQTPVTTSRRVLPQVPLEDPWGRVYGDTNGDSAFTSADVLFLEYYLVVSVFKTPQLICVPLPDSECQLTSQLTQWQLMQLKPVRNPNMPATRPDGSDVLFLLRALVGKAFFLTSLEIVSLPGSIYVKFRLCDYNQDCAPENAAARVWITAPANQNLGFASESSYSPPTGIITVDCTRTFTGEFEISTLPTTVTFDEAMAGLRITTQSLDNMGSPDSSMADDRSFMFNPLGPVTVFNILASQHSVLEVTPDVEYLPTTICNVLCDDASLFLDSSTDAPVWLSDTAILVSFVLPTPPRMQGFWPAFQPPGITTESDTNQTVIISTPPSAFVWVGGTFNVTVSPPPGVLMVVYRIQSLQSTFTRAVGGEVRNGLLVVYPPRYPTALLTFTASKQGNQEVTITMLEYFPMTLLPSPPVTSVIQALSPFIAHLIVQPQCIGSGVILWSKLWGLRDEYCNVLVTPVWSPASYNVQVQPVMLVCSTYPCILQAFSQTIRPVITTYIPTRPRIFIQRTELSIGQRSQWRVTCSLQGLQGLLGQTVTVNQRALDAGMIQSQPANALVITKSSITGAKIGTATVSFSGMTARMDVTDTVNPPRSLRGFAFTGIDFSTGKTNVTANFNRGSLVAGGKAYLFLQALYSGGYTLLLDPKPKADEITVFNLTQDIIVSQLDGSITVRPNARGGPDVPIVQVQYRGVILNISAPITPLIPISITACCDLAVAGPASSLYGLLTSQYPSEIKLTSISIIFQDIAKVITDITDPRIQVAFNTEILAYAPSRGVWTVLPNAPAQASTYLNVSYVQPYTLITIQTQLQITLVDGVGLEVTPATLMLHRIHCSESVFETSQSIQATIGTPDGKRLTIPTISLSSSDTRVARPSSLTKTITGVAVGTATITVGARGYTRTLQVQVVGQNILLQSLFISSPTNIKGVKSTTFPITVGGILEGGVILKDISFLRPVISIRGYSVTLASLAYTGIIQGNSQPQTPAVVTANVQNCLGLASNLTTASNLVVKLTPVISATTQPADVLIQALPDNSGVSIRLVGSGNILGFYIQIQTELDALTSCTLLVGTLVFADCTPNAPTRGGLILAGTSVEPLPKDLELAIVKPVPNTAWGYVEVYTGLSAVRVPIVAGQYGLTSPANPVAALMPGLPTVDTSVLARRYSEIFRWPAVAQSVRNSLFNLLLLVYKQRNVDPRLYSNDFELSAMFQVTDRFMQPDTNTTSLLVLFHTDQLPDIQGGVLVPELKSLQVQATHVQDGWYVVEWMQKIPVLSVPISFTVYTSYTNISWPWEIPSPLMTGAPIPNCPRSATDTGTFLATYYLTGNITQALIDRISCSIKVATRRIMVSTKKQDGRIALSIGLESLARVHQANLVIMSKWFTDQLTNMTSWPDNSTSVDMIRVERADLAYINDTSDPPTPCPNGFYFSKNGTYTRLPPHAFSGPDCYDLVCMDGYSLLVPPESQSTMLVECVPNPVTLDVVWICVILVVSLICLGALVIFCVNFMCWKQSIEGTEVLDFNKPDDQDPQEPPPTFESPPFSENDQDNGQFKNILTDMFLDDYSTIMLDGEFSPIPLDRYQ